MNKVILMAQGRGGGSNNNPRANSAGVIVRKQNIKKGEVTADMIEKDLKKVGSKQKSKELARFFKTGKGEYGHGDVFIGVVVPDQRIIAKKYFNDISFKELQKLLNSKIHEHRFTALIILVYKYKTCKSLDESSAESLCKKIFDFYVKNFKAINNWDLVDVTCRDIVGAYLHEHCKRADLAYLLRLAKSKNLWERRISIISTFYHISKGELDLTYTLAKHFLQKGETHDLMHKAIGWVLREAGKRDTNRLINFLKENAHLMASVCLNYSMEKLTDGQKNQIRGIRDMRKKVKN